MQARPVAWRASRRNLGTALRLVLALGLAAFTAAPDTAHADRGDVAVGAGVAWQVADAVRPTLGATLGITDWLALRLDAGATVGTNGTRGIGTVGIEGILDVWSWVPVLLIAGGATLERSYSDMIPFFLSRAEVRYYLTSRTWCAIGAGPEIDRHGLRVSASASVFYRLD